MNLPMSDFGVTWTLLLILYHVGESWVWCSLEYLVGTYRKTVSHQAVKQNCPKLVADNTIQWWQMPLSQSNFLLGRWKLMANKSRQVTFSLWWKITYNFGDQPSRKNETADICPSYLCTSEPHGLPDHLHHQHLATLQITRCQPVLDTQNSSSVDMREFKTWGGLRKCLLKIPAL